MSTAMPNRSGLRSLLTEFGKLVWSWWQVDRIRISPQSGLLLRIGPGCVIAVRGRTMRVVTRTVSHEPAGTAVCYGCDAAEGPTRLRVAVTPLTGILRLFWLEGAQEIPIAEDDVEVWG